MLVQTQVTNNSFFVFIETHFEVELKKKSFQS